MRRPVLLATALLATAFAATGLSLAGAASAATVTVKLAKEFGISYLPLTVIEKKGLLEIEGKKLGLDLKTQWLQFTGGSAMNEALISDSVDIVSGGVGPALVIWAKTRGNLNVKSICALNAMPLYLNTTDAAVKSVKDFTAKDKIGLPAVKVSIQAVTLQMAAAKAFGPAGSDKLDALTVSMGHPDAMAAMLSGKSEVNSHFGSPPFQYEELKDKRVHKVLDSYQVLGGPHTFNVVWTTTKFHDAHPKVIKAFIAALRDAEKLLRDDPAGAAAIYIADTHDKTPAADIEAMIKLPENQWTVTPKNIMGYADFMAKIHLIKAKPASWKDVFFPEAQGLKGS